MYESVVFRLLLCRGDRGLGGCCWQVQLVSDDVVEKRKAKELAGKVRDVIQGTCEESHVGVKLRIKGWCRWTVVWTEPPSISSPT